METPIEEAFRHVQRLRQDLDNVRAFLTRMDAEVHLIHDVLLELRRAQR